MARGGEQGFCCERTAEYKLEIDVLFAKCLPPFQKLAYFIVCSRRPN